MLPAPASRNEAKWPRHKVETIEARKRDFIVRISDWSRDKHEPAFDVEVYIGGIYDWNESKVFSFWQYGDKAKAKAAAIAFANEQTEKLL